MTKKILVVDDDVRLQGLLARYLGEQGFATSTASEGVAMYRLLLRNAYQLIILDINMPGENGLQICQRLRATGNTTPVIMLTARGEDVDRIRGLELGADDYLAKPFNPRELVARIHSVIRRHSVTHTAAYGVDAFSYEYGSYTLDAKAGVLTFDGKLVSLNHQEFALLKILVRNAGVPLSRTQISDHLYGRDHQPDQRAVDMLVSRLRKQLAHHDSAECIHTVRGVGYMFKYTSGLTV